MTIYRVIAIVVAMSVLAVSIDAARRHACRNQDSAFWIGFAIPIGGCR